MGKKKLSYDWQPNDHCYFLLDRKGISKEFAGHCMEAFKLFFISAGYKRGDWNLSFLRWVKKDWEKLDKTRHYRQKETNINTDRNLSETAKPIAKVAPEKPKKTMTKKQRLAFADQLSDLFSGTIVNHHED